MTGKKVSLNEIMGSQAGNKGKLSMRDLPAILGEGMPELPKNGVGRFRLIRALQQRFGNNFRRLPGVTNILKEFDQDIEHQELMDKLSKVKPKRSK